MNAPGWAELHDCFREKCNKGAQLRLVYDHAYTQMYMCVHGSAAAWTRVSRSTQVVLCRLIGARRSVSGGNGLGVCPRPLKAMCWRLWATRVPEPSVLDPWPHPAQGANPSPGPGTLACRPSPGLRGPVAPAPVLLRPVPLVAASGQWASPWRKFGSSASPSPPRLLH